MYIVLYSCHSLRSSLSASEGKIVEIECRGPIAATATDVLGGLRSACTYVGAAYLKELSRRTTFIRVTQQTNEVFSPFEVKDKEKEKDNTQCS